MAAGKIQSDSNTLGAVEAASTDASYSVRVPASHRSHSSAHPLASNLLVIAEEAASVRDAENFLSDFSEVWALLPAELQPCALRNALWSLTVAWLANPLQAEIRLLSVAQAASLPKNELRKQVKERAEFCTRYGEIYDREPQATTEALCRMIL